MERNKLNKRSLFGVGFACIVSALGYQTKSMRISESEHLFSTHYPRPVLETCNIGRIQSNGLQAKHLICLFLTSIWTSTHPCNEWDYRCFQTKASMQKGEKNIVKYMIEDKELKMYVYVSFFSKDLLPASHSSAHTQAKSKETFIFWFLKKENWQQMVVIRLRVAKRNKQQNEILAFVMHNIRRKCHPLSSDCRTDRWAASVACTAVRCGAHSIRCSSSQTFSQLNFEFSFATCK